MKISLARATQNIMIHNYLCKLKISRLELALSLNKKITLCVDNRTHTKIRQLHLLDKRHASHKQFRQSCFQQRCPTKRDYAVYR